MNQILSTIQQVKAERDADVICVFRMGDFWELFGDDARVGADLLSLTFASRTDSDGTRVPMAGFPAHRADYYLRKLVAAGRRVAVCEVPEG